MAILEAGRHAALPRRGCAIGASTTLTHYVYGYVARALS